MAGITIFTVGHSTHPMDQFLALLGAHGINSLVDVRTIPKSRHNPQFMEDVMAAELPAAGISYRRAEALGGLRPAHKDSVNTGWRNASFRNYADYMQTPDFAAAVDGLLASAAECATAIMCAEAVPWRCHRSLIGDALLLRGATVLDIMTPASAKPHQLTPFARADGLTLSYPPLPDPAPVQAQR
jgi:uncharacterized protein (DUF488 family)